MQENSRLKSFLTLIEMRMFKPVANCYEFIWAKWMTFPGSETADAPQRASLAVSFMFEIREGTLGRWRGGGRKWDAGYVPPRGRSCLRGAWDKGLRLASQRHVNWVPSAVGGWRLPRPSCWRSPRPGADPPAWRTGSGSGHPARWPSVPGLARPVTEPLFRPLTDDICFHFIFTFSGEKIEK